MATLNINGKRVKVDDSFLQLSPEQQQATVEEIAGQLGASQPQPAPNEVANAGLPVVDPNAPGADGNSGSPAFQDALAQIRSAAPMMQQQAPTEDTDRLVRANQEATKLDSMMAPTAFNDASKSAQKSFLGNFGDEAYSTLVGAPMRMLTEGTSYSEGYKRSQALQKEMDRRREERSPTASTVGNIAGGIGGVASLGKVGFVEGAANAVPNAAASIPLLGRLVPQSAKTFIPNAMNAARTAFPRATQLGSGLADATALGAMYEAGDADPGNRLGAAGWGALTGAGTGLLGEGLAAGVGKVASKFLPKNLPAAPATEDLAAASSALYEKARQSGVSIKTQSFDNLANDVQAAAGRINEKLRPETAGIAEEVMAMKGKPLDLQGFDELRQQLRLAKQGAKKTDQEFLGRIQRVMDNYTDNIGAGDITGDIKGFQYIKDARKLWAQKSKSQEIENLLDLADVDTGKYTQSGMANTIRQRTAQLYRDIKKGRNSSSWSKDEIALIRQMAKGGSNSKTVNLLSKLAPRGVISAGLPQTIGGLLSIGVGPAGLLVNAAAPSIGYIAGTVADRGALAAANSLRDAAARGFVAKAPQLPSLSPYVRPLIGGGVAGTTSIGNSSR